MAELYRRRVFYNTMTGAVLRSYMATGYLRAGYTPEQEAAHFELTDWGCMEWITPDADIEAAFEPVDAEGNPRIVNVSVDVSGEAPQLVFTYEAIPEMESETEDMAAALALLGVEPEEGA